ncbi:MAG: DUF2318 domain-containing protein [Nanoarchaeota archaeon]|nr:DUF2318 domain-containing protein [Nanoarchaeota archaeon]MBU1622483.1 DUF2318 domain-containing protein [Nanoarchaeota archaeon]
MKTKTIGGMVILGILLLVVAGCSSNDSDSSGSGATASVVADFSGTENIKIPLELVTGKLQKYEFDANGVTVKFFTVRGSDGTIKTAFDACDVCGGYKGYEQQGTDIKCKNCGKIFKIDGLGTKNRGYGCWPSYLSYKIEDGNVVISKSELEQGAYRFA